MKTAPLLIALLSLGLPLFAHADDDGETKLITCKCDGDNRVRIRVNAGETCSSESVREALQDLCKLEDEGRN